MEEHDKYLGDNLKKVSDLCGIEKKSVVAARRMEKSTKEIHEQDDYKTLFTHETIEAAMAKGKAENERRIKSATKRLRAQQGQEMEIGE